MPFLQGDTDPVFEFAAGALRGTQWLVELAVCQSPCCPCLKCESTWSHVVATETAGEPQRFWLDLSTHGLERPAADEHAAFANAFLAQATPADWDHLLAQFRAAKQELYEETDLTSLDADFQFSGIEGDGLLVGYNQVFPFLAPLRPTLGGKPFVVVDSYCVRLDCDCQDVSLTFCVEDRSAPDGQRTAVECLHAFLDLRQRLWRRVVPTAAAPAPPDALLAEFLTQVDAYTLFPERRRVLRALYRHNRGKYVTMPVKAGDKIGRNDPCPCGSGRKYKKCCMGKTV